MISLKDIINIIKLDNIFLKKHHLCKIELKSSGWNLNRIYGMDRDFKQDKICSVNWNKSVIQDKTEGNWPHRIWNNDLCFLASPMNFPWFKRLYIYIYIDTHTHARMHACSLYGFKSISFLFFSIYLSIKSMEILIFRHLKSAQNRKN